MTNNKKVAVGLSGGVDSSVSALLLKQQGYDVTGVFMKCWDEKGDGCTAEEDRASAVSVAAHLDINFKSLDYTKEYSESVVQYFYDEYRAGRTPNPDVMCNKEIKFGLFLDWALESGFDYVATGHYARIEPANDGLLQLMQGVDQNKDQSYFLYRLKQPQLNKILFPLGDLHKDKVRRIAKENGLATYDRPDSQGICFIGKINIKEFLKRELPVKEGPAYHTDGSYVGTHDGVWFYTIGQRHGFEIKKYYGLPLYVVDKDVKENKLIVGFVKDALKSEFSVSELSWVDDSFEPRLYDANISVRIRHLGTLHDCLVTSGEVNGVLDVKLSEPTFGVAPGQSAVFYTGSVVLGGGIIT